MAGGFFLSFFVHWVFATLLALALGAVATAFDQTHRGQRVSAWLALPATGVFAFIVGSFLDGFGRDSQMLFQARLAKGALETIAMMFAGGVLPFEGSQRLSPWSYVATAWVVLTITAILLGRWLERRAPAK